MFSNIGGKVKGLAWFFFIVGIIASLVWAISLWTVTESVYQGKYAYPQYKDVHPYLAQGFGVLIGGIIGSWIGSWALYAIGDTADNSAKLVAQNNQIIAMLQNDCKNISEKPQEGVPNMSGVSNSHFSLSSSNSAHGPWKCKKCGCDNPSSAKMCQGCGEQRN